MQQGIFNMIPNMVLKEMIRKKSKPPNREQDD